MNKFHLKKKFVTVFTVFLLWLTLFLIKGLGFCSLLWHLTERLASELKSVDLWLFIMPLIKALNLRLLQGAL